MLGERNLKGTAVCTNCMEDKVQYSGATLPCLELNELHKGRNVKNAKSILCKAGPYNWCPRFCNLPYNLIDIKVQQELPHVVKIVEGSWLGRKLVRFISE
jgi:hypothetical protein